MITSRQVLGAIGLLSQVEEPRGLLKLVVSLKASSKEGLVGHQLDSGLPLPSADCSVPLWLKLVKSMIDNSMVAQ